LAKWNNTDALEKIADWRAEGIAVEDFFAYALSFIPNYTTAYKAVSEHILEERKSAPERPI
jgi:predicted transposase YbfD/YdcC